MTSRRPQIIRILTAAFAIVAGLSMFSTEILPTADAVRDYLKVVKIESTTTVPGTLDVSITTAGKIPTTKILRPFGYAIFTDSDGSNGYQDVLVLVTDANKFDDSSHENSRNGFHTHVLDLISPTNQCPGFDAEVDLEEALNDAEGYNTNYKWKITGTRALISGVPISDLNTISIDRVLPFTLTPILDESSNPPAVLNMCIDLIT